MTSRETPEDFLPLKQQKTVTSDGKDNTELAQRPQLAWSTTEDHEHLLLGWKKLSSLDSEPDLLKG